LVNKYKKSVPPPTLATLVVQTNFGFLNRRVLF
jgi:hypothetical protein